MSKNPILQQRGALRDYAKLMLLWIIGFLCFSFIRPGGAFPEWALIIDGFYLLVFMTALYVILKFHDYVFVFSNLLKWAGVPLLLLVLLLYVQAMISGALALERIPAYFLAFFIFFIVSLMADVELADDEEKPQLAWVCASIMAIFAGIMGFYGLYQVWGPSAFPYTFSNMLQTYLDSVDPDNPIDDGIVHALSEGRAFGTLGAPNIFAGLLLAASPLALSRAIIAETSKERIIFSVALVMMILGVLQSGSRGGLLALFVALGFFTVLFFLKNSSDKIRRASIVGAAALMLLAAAIGVFAILNSGGEGRWLGSGTILQRFYYWQTALEIWKESPIFGLGPAAFEIHYGMFRQHGSGETIFAHNWFFQLLTSGGIVAAGLVLFALGAIYYQAERRLSDAAREEDRNLYVMRAGWLAAMTGLLAHGFVDYTLEYRELLLLFAISIPMAAGGQYWKKMPQNYIWIIAGLLFLTVGIYNLAMISSRSTTAALKRDQISYYLEVGNRPRVETAVDEAFFFWERDPRNWEVAAYVSLVFGDPDEAIERIDQAIELQPQSARLHQMKARILWEIGEREEAIQLQEKAVSLHPLAARHQIQLASWLFELERDEEVAEILSRIDGTIMNARERADLQALKNRIARLNQQNP